MASTNLGGDEVAVTAGDVRGNARTDSTTVVDAETNVNMVEVATDVIDVEAVTDVNKVSVVADVSKVDEITDADPETRGPTRRVPSDTRGRRPRPRLREAHKLAATELEGKGAGSRPADVNVIVDTPDVVAGDRGAAVEDEDAVNDFGPKTEENTRREPANVREELPRLILRRKRDGAAAGLLIRLVGMDGRRFLVFWQTGGSQSSNTER